MKGTEGRNADEYGGVVFMMKMELTYYKAKVKEMAGDVAPDSCIFEG